MQILVNSDKNISTDRRVIEFVEAEVARHLKRFARRLTRVEVHLSDVNSHKFGTHDKRCMIEVRPLGFLELVDSSERDQKILAVPMSSPRYQEIHAIDQVWPHMRREIEHFFTIYKDLEGKQTRIDGWRGPIDARKLIVETREAYLKRKAQPEVKKPAPKKKIR